MMLSFSSPHLSLKLSSRDQTKPLCFLWSIGFLMRATQCALLYSTLMTPTVALGLAPMTHSAEDLGPRSSVREKTSLYASSKKLSKNKNFKKKTKSSRVDDFGPMDVAPVARGSADLGIGVHREQEGVDRPYALEIATSSGSVISSFKGDRGNTKTSLTSVETQVEITMILGQIQLGLEIVYLSKEETQETPSTPTTKPVKNTEVKLGGGPVAKVNFGNLDTELTVPFAYVGGSYVMDELKFSNSENISYSGNIVHGGIGVHLFLDSNVSFSPKLEFFTENLDGANNNKQTQKGPRGLVQLAIFL